LHYLKALILCPVKASFLLVLTLAVLVFAPSAAEAATVSGNGTSCSVAPTDSALPRIPATSTTTTITLAIRCYFSPTHSVLNAARARITDGNYTGETSSVLAAYGTTGSTTPGSTALSFTQSAFTWSNVKWGRLTDSTGSHYAASDAWMPDNYWQGEISVGLYNGATARKHYSYLVVDPFGADLGTSPQHVTSQRCVSMWSTFNGSFAQYPCARGTVADEAWWLNTSTLNDWGDPFVPPVDNRCESVKIAVEYNDTALTVSDYDDTLYPANGSPLRDDFVFLATFTDWNYETEPGGMYLGFRWPNGSGGFAPVIDIIDQVVINSGADSAWTFRVDAATARFLSQIQWQCLDTEVTPEADQDRYLPYWSPGASINAPNWQDLAQYLNPCAGLTITPTDGQVAPGAVARVPYNLGGSTGITSIKAFAYGVTNFLPGDNVAVGSSSLLGTVTGGPSPLAYAVAVGSGYLTFTLPSTVAEPVPYSDLVFACTDATVTGVIVAGSADLGLSGSIDAEQDPTCWGHSGMSLTKPASWVTGIGKMLSCMARDLFVPDSDTLLADIVATNETMEARPPFVIVYVLLDFGQDVADQYDSPSGTGCFDLGGIGVAGVDTGETCVGDGLDVQPAQRSTMALLMIGPLLLGLISHAVSLVRSK